MLQLKLIDEVSIIFKSLLPQTLENRAALRTAIATLAAMLIAFSFHFDKPYWSAMTVVLLANVYTGSVVDKAILRIIGATIGAWLGYFLAGLVVNSLLLYLLAIFLLISLAIYYYSFSSYAYAYLLGALSAFIVISDLAFTPQQTFYLAIWRPIDISLGVIISAVSAWCIFPNNIQDNLIKEADQLFDLMSNLLKELSKQTVANEPNFQMLSADNLKMKKKIRKSLEMIGFVRRELGIKRVKVDKYRALFDQFYNFGRTLTYFLSTIDTQLDSGKHAKLRAALADFFVTAQQDLEQLKKEFFAVGTIKPVLLAENSLATLHQLISANTTEEASPIEAVKSYLVLSPLLQQVQAMITNLSNILINNPVAAKHQTKLITNQQLLRNDMDNIVGAIKTALAAVLALCFWLVSDWPGGVNGIISSVVISIKKHLFEMKNISIYRFLGCLIGGGAALFPLAFFSLDLYCYVLILFFSIWLFSYFSFKYIAYSYIGLQASIAMVISMGQAGGPPVNLEPALERLGGIVIGIVASFLVANVLWRTDFFSLLSRHLRKLFRFLIQNLNQLLQTDTQEKRLYDLTSSFWLCRGLLEAFPLEHFKKKKQEKLIDYKKGFIQMTLIQTTISHIYDGIDRDSAYVTAANYQIDLKELEQHLLALYNADKEESCEFAKQKIDKDLAKIDLSSTYLSHPSDELANCITYINALNQLRRAYPGFSWFNR
ncbi:p-hydroxybenzoic acid efflux pump subunit AaeB [Legionella massiliensis]|uniref:p-hydroxybenzoic acid efflux pump subunit AaeB n=1 Tax=Legionella massiliensis TaxID=1034943 RepID=A0A078KVT8_9GAMM|nr:FUSC family protein [Legionella massiliensis]CDZ77106.1 p-hydroxybenzoic acid efflux pump subunit AaeB [Legionella massiliensis]CEE12844.1 p-hydroxybenzoic acid efflux pump subunit AaeB [Legionella massiliensis]